VGVAAGLCLAGGERLDRRGGHRVVLGLPAGSATTGRLTPGECPGLALSMPGPASYTGEDTVELVVPGSPVLVDRLLRVLYGVDGVRPASPGEFSARAYLAGRLSAEQAEGVGALIAASDESERLAAGRLASGETGARYARIADRVATLLALVEAGIDFTDQEDVVAIAPGDLRRSLAEVAGEIGGLLGGPGPVASTLPLVVLAGEPNAGKSTLFNALLGRERAVASDEAGTTRDVLRERLEFGGAGGGWWGPREVELADIAGTMDAVPTGGDGPEAAAQQATAAAIGEADVLVWCDPSGVFAASLATGRLARGARERGAALLRVRTKADLVSTRTGELKNAGSSDEHGALGVCALDSYNVAALRRAIADAAAGGGASGASAGATLLARHRGELDAALRGIGDALLLLEDAEGERHLPEPELIAGCLRDALDRLGSIAGNISPDDVIGRVFATFCVGK
jgi:tRNA modification GTPase